MLGSMRTMICQNNRARRLITFADIGKKLKKYAYIRIQIQMDSLNLLAVYINYVRLNENYHMQKESCKQNNKICRYWQKTAKIGLNLDLDHDP